MPIRWWVACLSFVGWALGIVPAGAQDSEPSSKDAPPARPAIMFNRWQEDWSVLADPRVAREPLDSLKYIPLSESDTKTYLSFGVNVRERFESNNAPLFGIGAVNQNNNYLLSRSELHADLRLTEHIQIFTQLVSDFAPWKSPLTPVDQESLGVEQAFVALVEPLGEGTLKVRLGRQEMAFDLQRFVAVRDGPNVRLSFDAAWLDYEIYPWRFIGFYSQPVQNPIPSYAFDNYSNGQQTFSGVRMERKLAASVGLDAYYARFTQADTRYVFASGNEQRNIVDVHFAGTLGAFDWDAETMGQFGSVGSKQVSAWYFGAIGGYTFSQVTWSPRLGLQFDIASGTNDPTGNTLGTFNPLFPNGYYFQLAGYTGFPNIIHLKPSLTFQLMKSMRLMLAVAPQWRQTTADAIYTQPNIPVPGTAGQPGSYTGTYGQLRLDWTLTPNLNFAVEATHFAVGDVIRRAGGRDADWVGVQLTLAW
jgi:hypothetical protein